MTDSPESGHADEAPTPQDVQAFYKKLDFGNMEGAPVLMQEFFQGDIDFVREALPKRKQVLEVGCGFGRLLKEISPVSDQVTGIDFSQTQVDKAREGLKGCKNVTVELMDASELTFPDNTFDVVVCLNNSLGNMPGIERRVAENMVRVVKSGGTIAIRVYQNTGEVRDGQIANYQRLGMTDIEDDGSKVTTAEKFSSRRFNEEELEGLVEGLEVKDVKVVSDSPASWLLTATKI